MEHASIIELKPKDVLIKKGTADHMFYFLLKGDLAIYTEEKLSRKSTPIGSLSQGQVFGALAILTGLPRTATVGVEKGGFDALVFAADFSVFGEVDDFSQVTLQTKLALYRIVINSTRFKLEGYKAKDPNHPLAEVYSKVKKFDGEKDSKEELLHHHRQASMLGAFIGKVE